MSCSINIMWCERVNIFYFKKTNAMPHQNRAKFIFGKYEVIYVEKTHLFTYTMMHFKPLTGMNTGLAVIIGSFIRMAIQWSITKINRR